MDFNKSSQTVRCRSKYPPAWGSSQVHAVHAGGWLHGQPALAATHQGECGFGAGCTGHPVVGGWLPCREQMAALQWLTLGGSGGRGEAFYFRV